MEQKITSLKEVNWSDKIEPIIKEAGELALSFYQKITFCEEKESGGMMTEADVGVEQQLIKRLEVLLPESGIFGEELGKNAGSNGYDWVIDPIDGTTNFVHGLPYFCVSISLTYQGKPQIGAIYNPITTEYFYAQRGFGAYVDGKKIQVNKISDLSQAVIAVGVPYKKEEQFEHIVKVLKEMAPKTYAFRHFGAVALDQAYVAAGRLDAVFFSELGWWDVAAGCLLIEEAGGKVSDFDGNPIDSSYETFLGAGPELYKQLKQLLNSR